MKLTVSEINDALDLAECCVHDKMHNRVIAWLLEDA